MVTSTRAWRVLGLIALEAVYLATMVGPVEAAPPPHSALVFDYWWEHWDEPVREQRADRSWTWGSDVSGISGAPKVEPYAEGVREAWTPDGQIVRFEHERDVRYYDKARMEYWPDRPGLTVGDNPWKVTTGLLATELMTGALQMGDETFDQHEPSEVPVAGDLDSRHITPGYGVMGRVMNYKPIPAGWIIIQTMDADGSVGADQRFTSQGVIAQNVGSPTGHSVASVFWDWTNQMGVTYNPDTAQPVDAWIAERVFPNPFYATGYPTTEAYWTRARVRGVEQDVLVQCFERRCLTYTPGNTKQWLVEISNIGLHYYHWRYVEIPAE